MKSPLSHHFVTRSHTVENTASIRTEQRTSKWNRMLLCKLNTKLKAFKMAADVYRCLQPWKALYKLFSSSLLWDVTGSGEKAHFNQCLSVLGTTKTTYKAIYFVQSYVLKLSVNFWKRFGDADQPVWEEGNFGMFFSSCGSGRLWQEAKYGEFGGIYREL